MQCQMDETRVELPRKDWDFLVIKYKAEGKLRGYLFCNAYVKGTIWELLFKSI